MIKIYCIDYYTIWRFWYYRRILRFYLFVEDSDEEIGKHFGEDILKLYGDIDIRKAKEYQNIVEEYYPIETIIYGIKNNREDFIEKGRRILNENCSWWNYRKK